MIKTKISGAGNLIFDTINPIQTATASTEKLIRLISLIFFAYGLYHVLTNFKNIISIVKGQPGFSFVFTGYIFPLIFMLGGSVLFWLRKQTGWIMLAFFSGFSMILCVHNLYKSLLWLFSRSPYSIFQPSLTNSIVPILFYLAVLYVFCKRETRAIYGIDKQKMTATILIAGGLGIFFIFVLSVIF